MQVNGIAIGFSVVVALEQTAYTQEDQDEPLSLVVASTEPPSTALPRELEYISTAADFVVGAAARFEANLVAVSTLKLLEGTCAVPGDGYAGKIAAIGQVIQKL